MPSLLITLLLYLIVGVCFLGWGHATARFLHIHNEPHVTPVETLWLGFATVILVLQFAHLGLPLDGRAAVPIFAFGIGFSLYVAAIKAMNRSVPRRLSRETLFLGAALALAAAWIALRSVTQDPEAYDSGLYHFSAVRWIYTFPIVPGLGNLHGRLAINSSLFPFVAALDFYPWFGFGHSIANSFLLLLALATMGTLLRPTIRHLRILVTSHAFLYLAPLFALPPLAYAALSSDLASPSPDVTSVILQVVVFVLLAHAIANWRLGKERQDYRATVLLVLAVAATTIKLSNLVFSAGVAAFVASYFARRVPRPPLARMILPAAFLGALWCLRGFILSGAPFYPSTVGYVPSAWAVPRNAVVEEANWVYSWARQPGVDWRIVLANWEWFQPWLAARLQDFTRVTYPLSISLIACLLAAIVGLATNRIRSLALEWSLLIVPAAGLTYWFFMAPDIRFANALFFLLALCSSLLLLHSSQPLLRTKPFIVLTCVVFLIANFHFLRYSAANKWLLKPCAKMASWVACVPTATWQPIRSVPVATQSTSSGLVVYVPTHSDQCWDSPLPCAPSFQPTLRLGRSGDLSSGLYVTPP